MRSLPLVFVFLTACPWDVDPDPPPVVINETKVDLRARQTAIRNQGGRNTCITFGALAGVEAAYKRTTGADVDLSEEFLNHVGKMSWLHPNWNSSSIPEPRLANKPAAFKENQIGAFGGGGGPGYVRALVNDLRVIDEGWLPYNPWGADPATFPELSHQWFEPFWDHQLVANDYNLHPVALPVAAILAPRSFAVQSYTNIAANDTNAIERALRDGKEVVWDGIVEGTQSPIWRTCREVQPCGVLGAHAMLIVGYDRTAADANDHYFIVKNSWGRTSISGADGFTYISYDYIKNGYDALTIDALKPADPWTEARAIGRWKPSWTDAVIDLYHVPGSAQGVLDAYGTGITDRRFGGFYQGSTALRINGAVSGSSVTLYIDAATPNLRWDQLQGERIDLTLSADGLTMSGPKGTLRRITDANEFRALTASLPHSFPAREEREPIFPYTLP